MDNTIEANRHESVTEVFKELERMRSRARHNEAPDLRHTEAEQKKIVVGIVANHEKIVACYEEINAKQDKIIANQDEVIASQSKIMAKNDELIAILYELIAEKDRTIAELRIRLGDDGPDDNK